MDFNWFQMILMANFDSFFRFGRWESDLSLATRREKQDHKICYVFRNVEREMGCCRRCMIQKMSFVMNELDFFLIDSKATLSEADCQLRPMPPIMSKTNLYKNASGVVRDRNEPMRGWFAWLVKYTVVRWEVQRLKRCRTLWERNPCSKTVQRVDSKKASIMDTSTARGNQ